MAAETETVPEVAPELMPESMPEFVDVAGAVAMLDGAAEVEEAERQPEPAPDAEQAKPVGEPAEEPEAEADVEVEADPQAAVADEAPEFWSADDKAAWQDVPEGLRPLIAQVRAAAHRLRQREDPRGRPGGTS